MVSRELFQRIADLIAKSGVRSHDIERTMHLLRASAETPTEATIAQLVWDHVENVLWASGIEPELPPPATEQALSELDSGIRDRFERGAPGLLLALLGVHNGLRSEPPSALLSAEMIVERLYVLEEVDPTLLIISTSLAGDGAVLRVVPTASDDDQVYAFWHEDGVDDGLEPLARNLAEYWVLARESIVETVTDFYRGPTDLA